MSLVASGIVADSVKGEVNQEGLGLIASYMKNTLSNQAIALELLENLVNSGVLVEGPSYERIIENVGLMKVMRLTLAQGLPKTILESRYGLGIVSDWDLVHNCQTPARMADFFASKGLRVDGKKIEQLMVKHGRLYGFITRARHNLIYDMELPNTPPKVKAKDIRTQADVAIDIAKKTQSLIAEGAKKRASCMIDGQAEYAEDADSTDDDDEMHKNENHDAGVGVSSSSGSNKRVKQSEGKLIKMLIERAPEIKKTGKFMFIETEDGEEKLVFAPDDLNLAICAQAHAYYRAQKNPMEPAVDTTMASAMKELEMQDNPMHSATSNSSSSTVKNKVKAKGKVVNAEE